MDEADYMMSKLDRFSKANPEFTVLVIASMGQEAIEHEPIHNQLIIGDFAAFMSALGFKDDEYEKLTGMEPEYVVEFKSAEGLERFKEVCQSLNINDQKPTVKPINDRQSAFLVFQNNIDIESISVGNRIVSLAEAGLVIDPIQDMSGSTAQHVPGGCCFVFNGFSDLSRHSDLTTEHDLVAVTSSILETLDVESAGYMKSPVPAVVAAMKDSPAASGPSLNTQETALS